MADLQKEVQRLNIECDIYEKAAEIIKKDQGINLQFLTNREKAIIINALRDSHQLKELLEILNMAKSSYFYQVIAINTDKYVDLRTKIKDAFNGTSSRYGYRRIHSVIKSAGTTVSEKVIRRIMKEENLMVPNIKRKKYSSYKGDISPEVENIINRDFHADEFNRKWLTDITELHIPAWKVYLSPIIDCFDGLPVSWSIGTYPSSELVNTRQDSHVLCPRKVAPLIIQAVKVSLVCGKTNQAITWRNESVRLQKKSGFGSLRYKKTSSTPTDKDKRNASINSKLMIVIEHIM